MYGPGDVRFSGTGPADAQPSKQSYGLASCLLEVIDFLGPGTSIFLTLGRKTPSRQKSYGLASCLLEVIDFLGPGTSDFLALGRQTPSRQKKLWSSIMCFRGH